MKAVILKVKNKPYAILQVKDMSSIDFLKVEKECESNVGELFDKVDDLKKELHDAKEEIEKLKEEIKFLKGE